MSAQAAFKSGQLVRFLETTYRWYFALVKRVNADEVELVFLDETPNLCVPSSQIETLETFFEDRERKFSRTRAQLTTFFYGREFDRLREPRLREMQNTLRKAGVSFSPEEWPNSDTRIQLWLDGSVVRQNRVAPALESLLPQWLEPFVLPPGSRDPLGLQAPAEKLVNEVLPGLTVFTSRAGYYGFLTWAIRTVNDLPEDAVRRQTSRREVLNAIERALVLCEFVYHARHDHPDAFPCRLIGQRSKVRLLSSDQGDRYRVPDSILKNQNSAGCLRLYATSLVSLRLVSESDELAAGHWSHPAMPR